MTDARHDDKEPTPEQKRVQALKTRCLNIALTIAELFDVYEKFATNMQKLSDGLTRLRGHLLPEDQQIIDEYIAVYQQLKTNPLSIADVDRKSTRLTSSH